MQYRKDKHGEDLSLLGFGCMRFTRRGPGLDLEKAEREILAAFHAGVNYFDTAYIYPGSEALLGEVLARNGIREQVKIATKLPQYMIGSRSAIDRFFDEERSRLKTDYIDYYLMHHMTDISQWERLKSVGILDWIAEKKGSGEIRNIGFSYHGNSENFLKILNGYDWDFCMIQYNYLDEHSQAGRTGLRAAAEKGVPVMIMEPLRGGKLASQLPPQAKKVIAESGRGWSPAEWAFRWLYDQPEVSVVLSGMNSLEMVEENVRIASEAEAGMFTEEDFRLLSEVKRILSEKEKVPCTGCGYCMPCPAGVDIPSTFFYYNAMYTESKFSAQKQYVQAVALRKEPAFASQCVGCGKCEKHCPQSIAIREKLKEADRALRPLPYRAVIAAARKYLLRNMI